MLTMTRTYRDCARSLYSCSDIHLLLRCWRFDIHADPYHCYLRRHRAICFGGGDSGVWDEGG